MLQVEVEIAYRTHDVLRTLEESIMTFQVGMVGCDGLVIGSDRRIARRSPQSKTGLNSQGTRFESSEWQFSVGDKFKSAADGRVVCWNAGGPQAEAIARAVVTRCDHSLRGEYWREHLREIADSVIGNSDRDQVIVVRADTISSFELIDRSMQISGVSNCTDRLCTGLNTTSRFLAGHLWQKSFTVAQLSRLAVLTLYFAHKEQPSSVGDGFDVMTLTGKGLSWDHFEMDDKRIPQVEREFRSAAFEVLKRENP